MFCRAHAVQLDRARDDFEAAGVNLVLIGQSTPADAAHFRASQGIELPVLADAGRTSYQAIGATVAGLAELFGPKVVAKGALTALRTRARQGRTVGHPGQLGAAAVIVPGGEMVWKHIARHAGDNAPPEELLAAVTPV